eukprot:g22856.t1
MESAFITIGETGEHAHDLNLFIQLRGSFAATFTLCLLVGGIVLASLQCIPKEKKGRAATTSTVESDDREAALGSRLDRNASAASEHSNDKKALYVFNLFIHIGSPVFFISAGYLTAIASAMYAISNRKVEEVAYLIYYESLFFISAVMQLNLLRISISAFAAGALMILPATACGILADWPAGAIYPITVFILQMKEHREFDTLLNSLLPKEVLHSMQSNMLEIAYTYRDMTMLFADIVGFTGYCTKHKSNPSTAVRLVTHLFARFDDCCKLLGAYKVCTIGDAYLAVNEPKTQHDDEIIGALVLLHLAMAMLRIIRQVRDEPASHSRQDVLIGNQMESSGEPGRICCSETFVEVMKSFKQFTFTERELVSCSGSTRQLHSYLLDPPHGTGTGTVRKSSPVQDLGFRRSISSFAGSLVAAQVASASLTQAQVGHPPVLFRTRTVPDGATHRGVISVIGDRLRTPRDHTRSGVGELWPYWPGGLQDQWDIDLTDSTKECDTGAAAASPELLSSCVERCHAEVLQRLDKQDEVLRRIHITLLKQPTARALNTDINCEFGQLDITNSLILGEEKVKVCTPEVFHTFTEADLVLRERAAEVDGDLSRQLYASAASTQGTLDRTRKERLQLWFRNLLRSLACTPMNNRLRWKWYSSYMPGSSPLSWPCAWELLASAIFVVVTGCGPGWTLGSCSFPSTNLEVRTGGEVDSNAVGSFTGFKALRLIRITRLLKTLRVVRIFRFVMALRTLVTSIVYTLRSLFWALTLLLLIVYVFSVLITQAVDPYLRENPLVSLPDEELEMARAHLNSLTQTMLSLFMSISGGLNWVDLAGPLQAISTF